MKKRANYLPSPMHVDRLYLAGEAIAAAFGHTPYLVGSAMERPDFRDVDVRLILPDAEYARLIAGLPSAKRFIETAVSCWIEDVTGICNIDFQFQQKTEANEEHQGVRNALFLSRSDAKAGAEGGGR